MFCFCGYTYFKQQPFYRWVWSFARSFKYLENCETENPENGETENPENGEMTPKGLLFYVCFYYDYSIVEW